MYIRVYVKSIQLLLTMYVWISPFPVCLGLARKSSSMAADNSLLRGK